MDERAADRISMWEWGRSDPKRPAVVDPDGGIYTYGDMAQASNRVANALLGMGLTRASPVAAMLPNSHRTLEVLTAALQSGLYFVPINYRLTSGELQYILADCGAAALVIDAEYAGVATEAADIAGIPPDRRLSVGSVPGWHEYEGVKAVQSPRAPSPRVPGQRMYYTSGTTGYPKGVRKAFPTGDVDEHQRSRAHSLYSMAGIDDSPEGVHLVAGPMYHAAPLGFGLAALQFGQSVVLMSTRGRWSPSECLRLMERHQVTSCHMVPTMFHRLLQMDEDKRESFDVSSLQTIVHAAAPCPVHVKRQMIDWLGPIVHEYYSSSEGGGTSIGPHEWLERPGSVGRPRNERSEVKILDEHGNELPPRTQGLVYMRVTEPFEYHNDPEKTAKNRIGEFFTVGDIGYLDEDGYLFLCDRDSNMIISGGVNIYPAEAEAELMTHPSVGDAAVIGVPNDEWGEEVKAIVELAPGFDATDQLATELIEHCRGRLARYKCPRSVDFVDELPRFDNGKLYKRRLRERYRDDVQDQTSTPLSDRQKG